MLLKAQGVILFLLSIVVGIDIRCAIGVDERCEIAEHVWAGLWSRRHIQDDKNQHCA